MATHPLLEALGDVDSSRELWTQSYQLCHHTLCGHLSSGWGGGEEDGGEKGGVGRMKGEEGGT